MNTITNQGDDEKLLFRATFRHDNGEITVHETHLGLIVTCQNRSYDRSSLTAARDSVRGVLSAWPHDIVTNYGVFTPAEIEELERGWVW